MSARRSYFPIGRFKYFPDPKRLTKPDGDGTKIVLSGEVYPLQLLDLLLSSPGHVFTSA